MSNNKYDDIITYDTPAYKPRKKRFSDRKEGRRVRTMSIQYVNEAPAGQTLTVHRAYEDGVFYFKTLRDDGQINTLATVELADI